MDRLDPNVVLGLFNYPTPDVGPDGTNEIDIEFAKWGKPEAPMGNYTVWPAREGLRRANKRFSVELKGEYATHRFIWNSTGVTFQSLHGHHDDNSTYFADWPYQPQNPAQKAMPVRINLWLFQGQPPMEWSAGRTHRSLIEVLAGSMSSTAVAKIRRGLASADAGVGARFDPAAGRVWLPVHRLATFET